MSKLQSLAIIGFAAVALFGLGGCGYVYTEDDAATSRAKYTETVMKEAYKQVPPPNIKNFTLLRHATYIQELTDQAVGTYSYITDMNGRLHLLCESIGFGIPQSVRTNNPEVVEARYDSYGQFGTLPQPEPNGLYVPEGLFATYVMCSDGKGGVKPIFTEADLTVSTFKLPSVE